MRSENNRKAIEEKLQDVGHSNAPVPVLSISNKDYRTSLRGYFPKNAPVLTVEETNIPALRRHFYAFPNEARLNEARHTQNQQLPSLLNRIRLYTSRRAVDRKADIEIHVQRPLGLYEGRIIAALGRFWEELEAQVLEPLRREEADFVRLAHGKCEKWEGNFRNPAFLQLLNRDGVRRARGPKSQEVNLNAELIKTKAPIVCTYFNKVISSGTEFEKDLKDEIIDLYQDMRRKMEGE